MSKKYLRLNKRSTALTIGEFVIGLGIIAVLALILLPIFRSVNPDKNDALGKKANYIVNRIINELSTDTYLYPDNGEFSGFKNTDKVVYNGSEHSGTTKFCTLFASRIVKKPGTEVNCTPGNVSVTSSEGMDFYLPISDFNGGTQTITVDVNGSEGPNCLDKSGCSSPDRFVFKVIPGTRVPADTAGIYGPTALPPAKGIQPAAPDGPANDSRTAQNVYSISCGSVSGATIYGQGANKVNGNYTLVAIPKKGYKCDWFIHQVTVNDADVKDCQITCELDNNVPQSDGETPQPPVVPDDGDDDTEEDTYCISVNMTGDPEGCTISGDGCNLKPDIYTVTITVDDGYSADWTSQKVTIVDKDVSLNAVCTMEEPEECYAVTFKGDTEHCPVTLPDANCKKEEGKFRPGTYKYQVTPENGWSFKDSTKPVDQTFIVTDKDQEIEIECEESTLPPIVDIYVKDTFDGLYQDQMHTSNTYYHVSAKRYYDVRTLKVEVPDVYVKLQIKGKYTGTRTSCEAYSAANCSSSGLTLNENGIEAQFRQPLKHELANDGSIRWEVIEELGEGGGTGSTKLIQSKWETFTLTINDKVYAENAAWPSSSTVLEYEDKELNTVFKLHYESPKRYMYQFTEVDMDGHRVAPAYGANSYAWIIAKTNVVDCAGSGGCGGGFGGSIMGDGNYTYFEPGAPHIAHEGEPIHFRIGEPFRRCSDNRIYFPVGVFKNGSQVCSAPNWSAQQWAECDITVSGGQSFPSINSLTIKLDSCPADASGYRCEDGRSFSNIANTGSGCR